MIKKHELMFNLKEQHLPIIQIILKYKYSKH